MPGRPTIGVSDHADTPNEIKRRIYDRVRNWADLELIDPESEHPDLAEMGLDLYHMARWSRWSLADLERAAEAEIPTVNTYDGASTTEDRLVRNQRMEDAGIRVPSYEYGPAEEISLEPPVLVKPRHELAPGGHDFSVVYSGEVDFPGERFVQRYVLPRRSYKVFHVGEHVRSTRHPPGSGVDRAMRPLARETPTSRKVEELADAVADLFDLVLFELDLVVHKGVYVVDVNPVVSLDGVEDAVDVYDELLRRSVPDL